MKRNVKKTIEEVKINDRYDLDLEGFEDLARLSGSTLTAENYYLLSNAFCFGYAMGVRSAGKGMK